MSDTKALQEELRSSAALPFCPYDRRSPEYWTAPNDKPCRVCGEVNDLDAPNRCRGADTSVMERAADALAASEAERDAAHAAGVAAGRRAGIEQAAKVAEEHVKMTNKGLTSAMVVYHSYELTASSRAEKIAAAIRALGDQT